MEKICDICDCNNEDHLNKPEKTVFFICDKCLKSDRLPPLLDNICFE
jgi:hypothetical protein